MDEQRLAAFIGSNVGTSVDVRAVRRVTLRPTRAIWDADTSSGRFWVHSKVGGSPGPTPDTEFALMNTLADAGLPVAAPRWSEPTGEVLGEPFFIVDHVDAGPAGEDPSAPDAAAYVQTLARLHQLKPDAHLPPVDTAHAIASQIELWRSIGKSAGGPRVPLLDAAEMWLHKNVPLLERPSLVHGHPGPRNILTSDGRVVEVVDWEFAHVGSAAEDWSFLAIADSATDWRALIERETGTRISADEWSYWEAFNLFKLACGNRTYLAQFESGADRSPAKMIAGTAVFHDMLRRLMNIVPVD
jgi:aminoglycoside phosphotransferase (APT) family kinase protein